MFVNINNVSHLEVSLYCIAPNRIPFSLTKLANGLTIPVIKPFTWRKFARPILEDPSTKKTISAACTLLHLPANTEGWRIHWENTLFVFKQTQIGAGVVVGRIIWFIFTLSFSLFHGEQQDDHSEKPGPHLHKPGHKESRLHLLYHVWNHQNSMQISLTTLQNCNFIVILHFLLIAAFVS